MDTAGLKPVIKRCDMEHDMRDQLIALITKIHTSEGVLDVRVIEFEGVG